MDALRRNTRDRQSLHVGIGNVQIQRRGTSGDPGQHIFERSRGDRDLVNLIDDLPSCQSAIEGRAKWEQGVDVDHCGPVN